MDLLTIILRRMRILGAGRAAPPEGPSSRGMLMDAAGADDGSSSFRPPASSRMLAQVKCLLAWMVYRVLIPGNVIRSSTG
jgi:hypothetical protein